MGSIPKIVSTPLKWASKQLLHRTLLRFPGGDSHDPIACTYCPEMCRFACPTAVVTGNDAVTPCNKMSLLHKEERWPGQVAAGGQLWPLYDCTGCGRCSEFCVYGMPVAETLFAARAEFAWEPARKVAAALTDAEDPVGDLAEELGDTANSERRLNAYLALAAAGGGASRAASASNPGNTDRPLIADEPHSVHFLVQKGHPADLSWQSAFEEKSVKSWAERLKGRTWLVHESVWLSRRLASASEVASWVARAQSAGASLVLPFHHGKDCIDCGGEGVYDRLFESQATQMARDFWERDRHRAQGIVCFSSRCAAHFRAALGGDVPVVSLSES